MVSLKFILYSMLQMRKIPQCSVEIGKGTTSVPYIVSAQTSDKVKIGKYCSIGRGVTIIAHPGHVPPKGQEDCRVTTYPVAQIRNHGFLSRYYLPEPRNFVVIGNDVCLGANSIILPGVRVGDGAIVGAGAVVTRDISPYAIVAGVPARVVKYRYSPEQIEKLLRISWWNWDEKKIAANMDLFYGRLGAFIDRFYEE